MHVCASPSPPPSPSSRHNLATPSPHPRHILATPILFSLHRTHIDRHTQERFGVAIQDRRRVRFVPLKCRVLVEAAPYPRFTLLVRPYTPSIPFYVLVRSPLPPPLSPLLRLLTFSTPVLPRVRVWAAWCWLWRLCCDPCGRVHRPPCSWTPPDSHSHTPSVRNTPHPTSPSSYTPYTFFSLLGPRLSRPAPSSAPPSSSPQLASCSAAVWRATSTTPPSAPYGSSSQRRFSSLHHTRTAPSAQSHPQSRIRTAILQPHPRAHRRPFLPLPLPVPLRTC
jgi:hypothetical protein